MLRIFQWVVRFFDWLRVLDDRLEATWLKKGWPEFAKWWLGGSIGVGAFALLLACIPGAILLEINRLYQLLRVGSLPGRGIDVRRAMELRRRLCDRGNDDRLRGVSLLHAAGQESRTLKAA